MVREGIWSVMEHISLTETVEALYLSLNFIGETFNKVLVDDAIRGGKEYEDMQDKVAVIAIELVCPEGCLGPSALLYICQIYGMCQ